MQVQNAVMRLCACVHPHCDRVFQTTPPCYYASCVRFM